MSRQLRSIGVVSCAKVFAILYALLGVLIGAIFSIVFLLVATVAPAAGMPPEARGGVFGLIFGVGSIIFFPIMYGVIGAVGGLIMAGLYNLVAGYFGGIEVEIE